MQRCRKDKSMNTFESNRIIEDARGERLHAQRKLLETIKNSWGEIPIPSHFKRGDSILILRESKVLNTGIGMPEHFPLFAHPFTVVSVTGVNGNEEVDAVENHWTSYRYPKETYETFLKSEGSKKKAVAQLFEVGYIRKNKIKAPIEQCRLSSDVVKFVENHQGHLDIEELEFAKE